MTLEQTFFGVLYHQSLIKLSLEWNRVVNSLKDGENSTFNENIYLPIS